MGTAWDAAKTAGGVFTEGAYPYTSGGTGVTYSCKFDATQTASIGVKVTGYTYVQSGNDAAMKAALVNTGPLSVGLDASGWGSYSHGVYINPICNNPSSINHAVLVVGYGTDANGVDYWIVKNSW